MPLPQNWNILVKATNHNDTTSLKQYLTTETVNNQNEHGDRLIHFACRAGNLDILKCLVEDFGADVNVPNKNSRRPLHECIEHHELVAYLLSHNADPNGFKQGTWTPLMLAASKSLPATLTLLHTHGALLNPTNKDGWTCLHLSAQSGSLPCTSNILSHSPSLLWTHARNGMVPVHVAAKHGFTECVEALMGKMVEEEQGGRKPVTEKKKAVEVETNEGLTALHLSCHSESTETVKVLLDCFHTNFWATDKAGRNVLHHAAMAGHIHILQFLKAHLLENPTLLRDVVDGDVEGAVRREFERHDTFEGFSTLHWAAKEGFGDVVGWLTSGEGAGVGKDVRDGKGRTAREVALLFKNDELMNLL
ncbi:Ankyrin repeat domain-containing protein 16 [Rhizophlyctis rosea]|uniref:Ankyrin repeat domain-containing protein 16 n=1 Tax=Rhizophlyctis rosea TaxID=64517 RepID=A0AAD5SD67_9FUNG|nr:Ankyrin repeat domain-containing protein 16 [Rhizophlyctis rosea]